MRTFGLVLIATVCVGACEPSPHVASSSAAPAPGTASPPIGSTSTIPTSESRRAQITECDTSAASTAAVDMAKALNAHDIAAIRSCLLDGLYHGYSFDGSYHGNSLSGKLIYMPAGGVLTTGAIDESPNVYPRNAVSVYSFPGIHDNSDRLAITVSKAPSGSYYVTDVSSDTINTTPPPMS